MATTIIAGNATNGLALTPDNTGTLELKTGTGAGTTAISIDASQNVAITGTLTVGGIPAGGNYILTSYTSPSTWDATTKKAAGLKAIKVTVVGAGGAGGNSGTVVSPANSGSSGGGGGGGGAAIEYVPASLITPGTKTVTAGPGTNSFGPWGTATPTSPTATTSATAGSVGGTGSTPTLLSGAGGPGGVGSGGAITLAGNNGLAGASNQPASFSTPNNGGIGLGSALFSSFVIGGINNTPGNPAPIVGAGGGGAGTRPAATPGTLAGGTGGTGIVIVEEFY